MLLEASVRNARVRLVADDAYPTELRRLVYQARDRVWCSLFIVEIDPLRDPEQRVPCALRDLAAARWRGVDVRLLIAGSRSNLQIAEAVTTSMMVARHLSIPTRGYGVEGRRGSHVKLVVADDWVLTGSHNWSPESFGGQTQDSIAVHSRDLAAYLSTIFLEQWRRAEPEGDGQ